jgi:antitoxin component YwqK of YwqJK toxin-antitoxin module
MKNLVVFAALFLMFVGLNAQGVSASVDKDIVLEKVDKNSEMAFVYQSDVLIEKGLLVNGKREGVWQSFNDNGTLATEASFSKGLKNGVWNIYEGADLKYVLHYQNDLRVQANNLAVVQ